MAERIWRLFVDESGSFDDIRHGAVVAGWLVEADVYRAWHTRHAARLLGAAPRCLWPFHAAHMRIPALLGIAAQVEGVWGPPPPSASWAPALLHLGPMTSAALAATSASEDALDLRSTLGEPDSGGRVLTRGEVYGAARRADQALRLHAPSLYRNLDVHGVAAFGEVVRPALSAASVLGGGTWLVASGENRNGDGVRVPGQALETDRYLGLLECLFDRVCRALRELEADHRLDLQVLGRRVRLPESQEPTSLRAEIVRRLFEGAVDRSSSRDSTGTIEVAAAVTPRYDGGIPLGLIVADFAANRVRRPLEGRSRLVETSENVLAQTGLGTRLWTAAGERTTLTAAGAPWAYLRGLEASLQGLGAEGRPWAVDQALQWGPTLRGEE